MIVTFTSKNSAKIVMIDTHALAIMNLLGRKYSTMPERGVITKDQFGPALEILGELVHAKKDEEVAALEEEHEDDQDSPSVRHGVSLAQRAWPLYEMMVEADKNGDDILWDSESGY